MQDLKSIKSIHRDPDRYWVMSKFLYFLRDLNIKSAFPAAAEVWKLYIEELTAE